ncbi:MAG: hypothetical protein AMXMBFR64_62670 [Myxococcales bacterium]
MSEGFHRPFVAVTPVSGVALVPIREGATGVQLWARAVSDPRSLSVDDGTLAVARRALGGDTDEGALSALAASLGLGAAGALPAGRWATPLYGSPRWSLAVYLLPAPADVDAAGAWIDAAALAESHRCGRAWPGPLLGHIAGALAGGVAEAVEVLRGPWPSPDALDLGAGVAVLPLRTPTLPPATHTNCVVLGGGDALIIDPGSPYPDEQERLARFIEHRMERGDRFGRVVLTHQHHDHVAGAEALRARFDAVIVATRETAAALGGRARVDELILDGDLLPFGDRAARVVATPGHAKGHVALVDDATGITVAGDMVAGQGTIVVDPPEGDMAVYLASLERLRGARVLIPAHGPPIPDPGAFIDALVGHRLWREERIANILRERGALSIPALVPLAYDDVPAITHPLAARQALAHLLKLQAQGRAHPTPDGRWWVRA